MGHKQNINPNSIWLLDKALAPRGGFDCSTTFCITQNELGKSREEQSFEKVWVHLVPLSAIHVLEVSEYFWRTGCMNGFLKRLKFAIIQLNDLVANIFQKKYSKQKKQSIEKVWAHSPPSADTDGNF